MMDTATLLDPLPEVSLTSASSSAEVTAIVVVGFSPEAVVAIVASVDVAVLVKPDALVEDTVAVKVVQEMEVVVLKVNVLEAKAVNVIGLDVLVPKVVTLEFGEVDDVVVETNLVEVNVADVLLSVLNLGEDVLVMMAVVLSDVTMLLVAVVVCVIAMVVMGVSRSAVILVVLVVRAVSVALVVLAMIVVLVALVLLVALVVLDANGMRVVPGGAVGVTVVVSDAETPGEMVAIEPVIPSVLDVKEVVIPRSVVADVVVAVVVLVVFGGDEIPIGKVLFVVVVRVLREVEETSGGMVANKSVMLLVLDVEEMLVVSVSAVADEVAGVVVRVAREVEETSGGVVASKSVMLVVL
eukprot:CAMPEP_0115505242 /NCGR_PEP_ID=MMETSP0271-20121206/70454_1 /TAXON_ID=71861 /ORGANISM="Scrippsiella trochoidea, Strain CCMP3099" /LENGTH=352 /DNA_ID=CAMNT_0002934485 /DNA_START=207 /DNA_END=1262 /DNA_ORIENTATION=+